MRSGAYDRGTQVLESRRHPANPGMLAGVRAVVPSGSSIVDIGAGIGHYVRALRRLGYVATGLDGTKRIERLSRGAVRRANLIDESQCRPHFGCASWGLFNDVGEHVHPRNEGMLLDNVARLPTEGLIVNWAAIGQGGKRHVNCHSPPYVASRFALRGWLVDDWLTHEATKVVGKHFNRRILIMVKQ